MSAVRLSFAALVLATAGPVFAADPPVGKRYAFLVGVKDYDHANLKPLDFPEADVTELADLLRPAGYAVTLLSNTAGKADSALAPTRANVDAQLAKVLEKCSRHDTVLVALAGHGLQFEKATPDDPDDAFFCPVDAKPVKTRTDTLVSLRRLYQKLDESGAGVKLLLVDACRDDPAAGRGRGVDGNSSPRPPRGVAALFSCSAGERAFEHDKLKHGVFFHYVLEGLKGQAKDADGEVTWDGLQTYVRRRVSRDIGGLIGGGVRQTPALNAGELAGESPVLVAVRPTAAGATALKRGLDLYYGRGVDADVAAAAAHFRAAADAGSAEAMYYTGLAYGSGFGVPFDDVECRRWLQKAVDGGHPGARYDLAGYYRRGGRAKDNMARIDRLEREAMPEVRRAAEAGDPTNQTNLGEMYLKGVGGLDRNEAEAVKWFRIAARGGEVVSQQHLGEMYLYGEGGLEKDEAAAEALLRKAANAHHPTAMHGLGFMYLTGRGGLEKDEAAAEALFRKAADAGEPSAMRSLGAMYQDGRGGLAKDDAEAARWYRKAADAGHPMGMINLGRMYQDGRGGLAKDDAEAARWYRKAADAGHPVGMTNMGVMCQDGRGVPQNHAEAVGWYKKAADAGDQVGMCYLGQMCEHGLGMEKDLKQAIEWYQKAAKKGDRDAEQSLKRLGVSQ